MSKKRYTYEEFIQVKQIRLNVLTYHGIIAILPKVWLKIIGRNDQNPRNRNGYDIMIRSKIKWSAFACDKILQDQFVNDNPPRF